MNAWPALLKRPTLAKYLEVSVPSLEKELAAGRLREGDQPASACAERRDKNE